MTLVSPVPLRFKIILTLRNDTLRNDTLRNDTLRNDTLFTRQTSPAKACFYLLSLNFDSDLIGSGSRLIDGSHEGHQGMSAFVSTTTCKLEEEQRFLFDCPVYKPLGNNTTFCLAMIMVAFASFWSVLLTSCLVLRVLFTCALMPGCPMSHTWLPTVKYID